jgi:D-3-phosphoglycerate dehydrogenase
MTVLAHDPYLPAPRARELGVELAPLEDLLGRADVVTLHVPLTDETRRLIDADRLGMMKSTAFLVNAARGELVDTDALLAALDGGRLAGAALDVFDPEPLPADSPLRRCDGVILTPHLAASTTEAQERVAREICAAVRDGLLTGLVGGAVNLPGISRQALGRLRWVLDLARRCGRLASGIARGRVQAITVAYGGEDEAAPRPVMLAAVEGALTAMGVGPVSLVNAAALAQERGISVERRVGEPVSGFGTTVGVTLATGDREVTVVGAAIGERVGRIIQIDEFLVDVPADQHVLVLRNRDVPGVIGRVGTALGSANINIGSYHQSRLEPPGTEALAAIVVDQPPPPDVLAALEQLQDVLEVRMADLDGSR